MKSRSLVSVLLGCLVLAACAAPSLPRLDPPSELGASPTASTPSAAVDQHGVFDDISEPAVQWAIDYSTLVPAELSASDQLTQRWITVVAGSSREHLYVQARGGGRSVVAAVEAGSGAIRWQRSLPSQVPCAVVANGVACPATSGGVALHRAETGDPQPLVTLGAEEELHLLPGPDGDLVAWSFAPAERYSRGPVRATIVRMAADGREIWRRTEQLTGLAAEPEISGTTLNAGMTDQTGRAALYSSANGQDSDLRRPGAASAIAPDTFYFAPERNLLDASTRGVPRPLPRTSLLPIRTWDRPRTEVPILGYFEPGEDPVDSFTAYAAPGGAPLWEQPFMGDVAWCSGALLGRTLDDPASLVALRPTDGTPQWRAVHNGAGMLACDSTHVVGAASSGEVVAFATATGTVAWKVTGLPTDLDLQTADGMLFVTSPGRALIAIGQR